jgi:uncharacterized protein
MLKKFSGGKWMLFGLQLLLPSFGVLMGVHWFPGQPLGQAFFAASKFGILAIPLFWVKYVDKMKYRIPTWSTRGLKEGILSGLVISALMFAVWKQIEAGLSQDEIKSLLDHVQKAGLSDLPTFVVMSVYWCVINSLLEEYVWRWFVYGRFAAMFADYKFGNNAAAVASALFFTLHHTVALSAYVSGHVNFLASLGVFIGGTFWFFIYARYQNIYASWISHVIADVAIFVSLGKLIFSG